MELVLGIDLGTTNSLCAVYEYDEILMVPNDQGNRSILSLLERWLKIKEYYIQIRLLLK